MAFPIPPLCTDSAHSVPPNTADTAKKTAAQRQNLGSFANAMSAIKTPDASFMGSSVKNLSDDGVLGFHIHLQLFSKGFGLHQIADTNTYASYLIHIAGTDAALSGTNFMAAQGFLLELVQALMVGQYHMSTVGNHQIVAINALFLHAGDFSQHNAGVDYNAVALI